MSSESAKFPVAVPPANAAPHTGNLTKEVHREARSTTEPSRSLRFCAQLTKGTGSLNPRSDLDMHHQRRLVKYDHEMQRYQRLHGQELILQQQCCTDAYFRHAAHMLLCESRRHQRMKQLAKNPNSLTQPSNKPQEILLEAHDKLQQQEAEEQQPPSTVLATNPCHQRGKLWYVTIHHDVDLLFSPHLRTNATAQSLRNQLCTLRLFPSGETPAVVMLGAESKTVLQEDFPTIAT